MKRKAVKTKLSNSVALVIGVVVAVLCTVLVSVVGTIFIQNEYLEITSIGWIAFVAHLLGGYIGAGIVGNLLTERRLLLQGIVCIGYFLILVCVALLFLSGISGGFWYCFAGCAGGYLLVILTQLMSQKRSGSRKRRSVTG